jgi:PII-like signaling protein
MDTTVGGNMSTVVLRFYVSEKQHHHGELLHEWLLRLGQQMNLPGGSAFRAIAGFGKHGRLHEETFFELAGELSIAVEFVLGSEESGKLIAAVHEEKLNLHFVRFSAETGMTGN